jgi:putative toxin-antitoxin system antitoxin component (TIGR02293 family)
MAEKLAGDRKTETGAVRLKLRADVLASHNESAVIAKAAKVIGDRSEAMRWMGTPVRALDYATPVSLLGTREGRKAVMVVLGRLEHGVL